MSDDESLDSEQGTAQVVYWSEEIRLARQRNRRWWRDADKCVRLYEADVAADNNYNILFANTETLLPAIYNQLPRPVVERRFRDADPLGKAASSVLERTLTTMLSDNDGEYEGFHQLIQQATLAALVPGRGVTRFRYVPKFEGMRRPPGDEPLGEEEPPGEGAAVPEGMPEGEGDELFPDNSERVAGETICGEDLDYDEVLFGYARRWAKVPWVAFRHSMCREDLEINFGVALAAKVPLEKPTQRKRRDEDLGMSTGGEPAEDNAGSTPVAEVWEIWFRGQRKVYFLCPQYKDALLKELDDPLGLSGFYPIPKPLQFVQKVSTLIPTPLYKMYEAQARELNRITMRINRVLNALKVRGFYDGTIKGLKDLLSSEDNTLLPAKEVASLQDGKNLQNSIWLMPLNELVVVLQQLFAGRESCKAVIYEITGLSDIMRGSTQASETFGAQNLKSQWGTMRLQKFQGEVQRYVVDCLRIMGELAGEHFSATTFAQIANLDFATDEQVQQAQAALATAQQMALQQQQPPAMPGQPPAPSPPPNPQLAQIVAQAQETLAKPKWSEVLQLLKVDALRHARITIESNSTISPKNAEQQKLMTEAMAALSQLFQSFGPVVQQGALPLGAFKQMVLAISRRFEFGKEVEDSLAKMPDQMPQGQDPKALEQAKKQMEQQKVQLEQKAKEIEKGKMDLQAQQEKMVLAQEQFQEKLSMDQERSEMQIEMLIEKAIMKIEAMLGQHTTDVQGKLQGVTMQREADAKVDQRVSAERDKNEARVAKQQKAQSDARMGQAVQGVAEGTQALQAAVQEIMQHLAAIRQPRRASVQRDAEGNMTGLQAH